MVRAARDAGALRRIPVLQKFRIEMIAAFGGFDESETYAGFAHGIPVDVALPVGYVDALDRHGMSCGNAVMRLGVAQAAGMRQPVPGAEYDQRRRHRQYGDPATETCHKWFPEPPGPWTKPRPWKLKIFLVAPQPRILQSALPTH